MLGEPDIPALPEPCFSVRPTPPESGPIRPSEPFVRSRGTGLRPLRACALGTATGSLRNPGAADPRSGRPSAQGAAGVRSVSLQRQPLEGKRIAAAPLKARFGIQI
ncbi:uncharacterized protein LOC131396794 isoform X6 [Diceros bicornis minor]|uniref:uncharacterized protein LOC131396794 isoform X6 n=1 Tax=Diceros bicornis minor TaxID=77932 RepID=UPI0026EC8741|nr:uncharacterized protein LOC131396794 isoform X6 [Diceros bicornis minor]